MGGIAHLLILEDVVRYSEKVLRAVEDKSLEDLMHDDPLVDAALEDIEVIGAALKRLPEEVIERHRSAQWDNVVPVIELLTRGREAFGTDYEILWYFINKMVPDWVARVKDVLEKEKAMTSE